MYLKKYLIFNGIISTIKRKNLNNNFNYYLYKNIERVFLKRGVCGIFIWMLMVFQNSLKCRGKMLRSIFQGQNLREFSVAKVSLVYPKLGITI